MIRFSQIVALSVVLCMVSCSKDDDVDYPEPAVTDQTENNSDKGNDESTDSDTTVQDTTAEGENTDPDVLITKYVDNLGNVAYIPAKFKVSSRAGEQEINTGLVVIAPDGSEYVWIPTTTTELKQRDFGSYFSGNSLSSYKDETNLQSYQDMVASVNRFGGFYIGRYEASKGGGSSIDDYVPASKPVTTTSSGTIWVRFSPQDATKACENLYRDNPTVQGFFPWGCTWDTILQWLVDSGNKSYSDVASNSTSWGNYSDDTFSPSAGGQYTGVYEQAKANNIYDLAGNNWEWTQERNGSSYVMRSGGYNLMGGACSGSRYPAAIRDPLPGNSNHPNVCFRSALFLVSAE